MLVKLLPLTWARWPWTLTRAPGGLTVPLTCAVALWTMAVSEGAETLSCTGFCGLGGGVSAPHPQAGCRRSRMRSPSRIVDSQATARLESVLGDRYCVEHMFVRLISN